jgi:predicted TIM-barrel fold metal-dependent hydrolase
MIWDLHCHLSGVPGRTPDERMYQLIQYADRMGIDRLCVYMGMTWSRDPDPKNFRNENDEVLQAISHWHHRAFGFVYLNPRYLEESLQELDRCVRFGPMVGVKLWVAKECSAKELDPIVQRASTLKALVFQHTWYKADKIEAGESTPIDMAALAARHPNVPLVCGHTGGDWELGIRTVRPFENVYLDLAGSDPTSGFLEMALREVGPERILYGSDIGGRSFASQLAKVYGANISDAARKLILGENLKRLLTPILREKGVQF